MLIADRFDRRTFANMDVALERPVSIFRWVPMIIRLAGP